MNITFSGGNISIAVEQSAGHVHSTTIYVITWQTSLVIAILAILLFVMFRTRRNSSYDTTHDSL